MNAFTPAPWRVVLGEDGRASIVFGDGEITIADVRGAGDMAMAYARLIAAAPELLEALKSISAAPITGDLRQWALTAKAISRAAIAKAEGR